MTVIKKLIVRIKSNNDTKIATITITKIKAIIKTRIVSNSL